MKSFGMLLVCGGDGDVFAIRSRSSSGLSIQHLSLHPSATGVPQAFSTISSNKVKGKRGSNGALLLGGECVLHSHTGIKAPTVLFCHLFPPSVEKQPLFVLGYIERAPDGSFAAFVTLWERRDAALQRAVFEEAADECVRLGDGPCFGIVGPRGQGVLGGACWPSSAVDGSPPRVALVPIDVSRHAHHRVGLHRGVVDEQSIGVVDEQSIGVVDRPKSTDDGMVPSFRLLGVSSHDQMNRYSVVVGGQFSHVDATRRHEDEWPPSDLLSFAMQHNKSASLACMADDWWYQPGDEDGVGGDAGDVCALRHRLWPSRAAKHAHSSKDVAFNVASVCIELPSGDLVHFEPHQCAGWASASMSMRVRAMLRVDDHVLFACGGDRPLLWECSSRGDVVRCASLKAEPQQICICYGPNAAMDVVVVLLEGNVVCVFSRTLERISSDELCDVVSMCVGPTARRDQDFALAVLRDGALVAHDCRGAFHPLVHSPRRALATRGGGAQEALGDAKLVRVLKRRLASGHRMVERERQHLLHKKMLLHRLHALITHDGRFDDQVDDDHGGARGGHPFESLLPLVGSTDPLKELPEAPRHRHRHHGGEDDAGGCALSSSIVGIRRAERWKGFIATLRLCNSSDHHGALISHVYCVSRECERVPVHSWLCAALVHPNGTLRIDVNVEETSHHRVMSEDFPSMEMVVCYRSTSVERDGRVRSLRPAWLRVALRHPIGLDSDSPASSIDAEPHEAPPHCTRIHLMPPASIIHTDALIGAMECRMGGRVVCARVGRAIVMYRHRPRHRPHASSTCISIGYPRGEREDGQRWHNATSRHLQQRREPYGAMVMLRAPSWSKVNQLEQLLNGAIDLNSMMGQRGLTLSLMCIARHMSETGDAMEMAMGCFSGGDGGVDARTRSLNRYWDGLARVVAVVNQWELLK